MISEDLKHLVRTHENINKVYFAQNGSFYLNPHPFKDALFGTIINGIPKEDTLIVEVIERDIILRDVVLSELEVKEDIKPKKTKK